MISGDHELARRLEAADASRSLEFARASRRLHPGREAAWLPLAGGYAVFAGKGSPLNKGVGLGLSAPAGDEELLALEEFYRSREVQPALDLAPFAGEDLLERLAAHHYSPVYFLNVLAAAIGEIRDIPPAEEPIRIRRTTPDDESLWARTVAAGFSGEDEPANEDLELFATQFHASSAITFLAEIDGETAGGGLMAVSGGVVLLGATSVLQGFRGRGAHSALLRERIRLADELGCDIVMAPTSPGSGSQRNVERYGLRVMYSKVMMRAPQL